MSARGYGEPVGNEYGADDSNRERWRDRDERSSWRGEHRGRDEDRGFLERAGEEIRSWFSDDDDDRGRGGRDFERGRDRSWENERGRSYGRDQDRFGGWRGSSDFDRGRERGYGRMSEERSTFGGMAQSGVSPGMSPRGGRGASRADREWEHGSQRGGSSFGSRERGWGGQSSGRQGHAQSWGEANRGESGGSMGYSEFSGTLGGFGNQRFGSSQDDHYRSWRDRQMQQLDSDYEDYCRERERQFHSDFDSWRQGRQGEQGQSMSQSQSGSGSTSMGGTSSSTPTGSGSAIGGGSTTSTSTLSDTTGSTETAGTASEGTGSGGGRSGSRSRS